MLPRRISARRHHYRVGLALASATSLLLPSSCRGMVSLTGKVQVVPDYAHVRHSDRVHRVDDERPPDPQQIDDHLLEHHTERLLDWWSDKQQILCLTGAGVSTESGVPDYRGHQGSYHLGHKPVRTNLLSTCISRQISRCCTSRWSMISS